MLKNKSPFKKKPESFDFKKINKLIFIFIIVGIVILLTLGIYADYNELGDSISGFNFAYLPVILALAPLNYCLRFVKWNYYLKKLGIKIPVKTNIAVFAAGLSMTATPAKVGEFFKSYLLKEFCDIEFSKTAPVVLMERVTDGIAMIILASIGTIVFSYNYTVIIACILIVGLFIATIRIKPVATCIIRAMNKVKFLSKYMHAFENFYNQTYALTDGSSMFFAIATGTVSWFFEGVVIFFVLKAFGLKISILASVFTVSVSSLIGALSMLPGGLVAAETSIMGILILIFDVNRAIASATTIVTRFSTLWLGVVVGLVGMIFVKKMLRKVGEV